MTVGRPPRLTVVVPFFDVEPYIGDCVDSLVRQTFQDIEVVMVDDGSRDGSAAIARDAARRDARFRIVEQDNQGLGPARNTGAAHARGEYIAFVDSDDLVARNGFERMVASLDSTGSSFAASGARRFDRTGVRPSWVHTVPFAQDRIATHVLEHPALALDRMVWNKVYRRSFWEGNGYRFPAIRYEDYPVTLKAHLDAVTVDCLSAPSYYWRDRDVGTSITQLKYEYGNLLDRVVSAEMVTALVQDQPAAVRSQVHRHLAHVDLMALVQAFAAVPPDRGVELVALGRRLVGVLDADAVAARSKVDRLQLGALRRGNVPLLRELARLRAGGGRSGSAVRRPVSHLRTVARAALRPQTTVTGLRWVGTSLVVEGTVEHWQVGPERAVGVQLCLANGSFRLPFVVERPLERRGSGPVDFRATADLEAAVGHLDAGRGVRLVVGLRSGPVRRHTELHGLQGGEPQWAGGAMLSDGTWVQPRAASDGRLLLAFVRQPWRLLEAAVEAEDFVLRCALPGAVDEATLLVSRGDAAALRAPLRLDGGCWSARVPLSAVLDAADPDDPFTQRTTRSVRVEAGGREQELLWTGPTSSLSVAREDRLLLLTRSTDGSVDLQERPVRAVADAVQTDAPGLLRIAGAAATRPSGRVFWRRALPGGASVEVPCSVVDQDRSWCVQTPLSALSAGMDDAADLGHRLDWVLYAEAPGHPPLAVSADPFLLARLPVEVPVPAQDGVQLQVAVGGDSLHAVARRTPAAGARR